MNKRTLKMKPYFLTGVTGNLCLNNFGGIVIKINECGDGLQYQYNFGDKNPSEIFNVEIEYEINEEEGEGEYEACFHTFNNNTIFFLSEFMRSDY